MKISGAIFDVDGTLLDSMSIWDTIGADYLQNLTLMRLMSLWWGRI